MADEFEIGNFSVPTPAANENAAVAYQEVATRQEAQADEALWQELQGIETAAPNQAAPKDDAQETPNDGGEIGREETANREEFVGKLKTGLADLGLGLVEGPRQAVGGVADAFQEAGQFLSDVTGIGGFQIVNPETGKLEFEYLNPEEFQEAGGDSLVGLFQTGEAKSATGGFIRATSQFLTGFIPALRAARGAGITGSVTGPMAAGAVADMVVFDPHEERLSTFLNEIPALEPLVSDYLADNDPENQTAWEGRLKNAIEGAALGLTAEGVGSLLTAFRYYKAQRHAISQFAPDEPGAQREAAIDTMRAAAREELVQDVPDEALRGLGDESSELMFDVETGAGEDSINAYLRSIGDEKAIATAKDLGTGETQNKVFVNHARIQSADDVKSAIQQMADAEQAAIDEARGGATKSNAQTIRESSQEYRDLDDLIGRPPGPMTAAQAVAARRLLTASGEQITALAKRAAAPDATPADIYSFRRAMAVHYSIQSEVIAARTETARALQAWSIPAGATKARSEAIADLIRQDGGAGEIQQLAKAVSEVGDNPVAVNAMARELGKGKFGRALYQVWINGILSSPKTHMVNILSNSMVSLYSIPERMMAAGISKTFQNAEVDFGEVSAMAYGLMKGVRDGARLVYHGSKAGDLGDVEDVFDAFAKVEHHVNDISAEAFGLPPEGGLGRGIDMLGKVVNVPGSALQTEDKFFKSVNYRMELNAQAYRTAHAEGLEGKEAAERVAEILLDPPDNIKADALDLAHYNTFTNNLGKIGTKIQQGIGAIPGGRLVVPFIRTPTNIIKFSFARTPLAYMSSAIRADIKAGGARAAQAHARVAMGTMVMMTTADLALEGTITGRGPSDPRERSALLATGWKPYSVRVGDRWFQYSRLDPVGLLMGLGADMTEISTNKHDEETEMMVTAGVLSLANNLANKTYMQGIYDFIGAIDPNNPTNDPGKYLSDFAGSIVPYSSFLRSIATTADPVLRETRTVVRSEEGKEDAVASYLEGLISNARAKIPGLGEDLPPRRDLWGKPITRSSGLGVAFDFLSPVASAVATNDRTTQIIIDNKIQISKPPRVINGVQLNAEEYSEFSRLSGEPLKEYLDKITKTKGFKNLSNGPDGMKAEIIKDAVHKFRNRAKAIMMQQNPHLQRLQFQRALERRSLLQGE